MTSVCLRRLQELSAEVYKVGVPSLTESDEGAGTWRTDVRAQCTRRYDVGLPPATAGAFGEGPQGKRRSRCLTSPKATKEPERGEPMSERNVHGAARTN